MRGLKSNTPLILLLSIALIFLFFLSFNVRAADKNDNTATRDAQWYQAQYGTNPLGGSWMMGRFGPDFGIGEQGYTYQYSDPLTGSYISYTTSGLGMGIGGPLLGYQGMFSQAAMQSYGPFAYGNNPMPASTFGWSTEGYTSGSAFGPYTNYYSAQPMMSLFGLFGGYGFGGGFYGLGGSMFPGFGFGWW